MTKLYWTLIALQIFTKTFYVIGKTYVKLLGSIKWNLQASFILKFLRQTASSKLYVIRVFLYQISLSAFYILDLS